MCDHAMDALDEAIDREEEILDYRFSEYPLDDEEPDVHPKEKENRN